MSWWKKIQLLKTPLRIFAAVMLVLSLAALRTLVLVYCPVNWSFSCIQPYWFLVLPLVGNSLWNLVCVIDPFLLPRIVTWAVEKWG